MTTERPERHLGSLIARLQAAAALRDEAAGPDRDDPGITSIAFDSRTVTPGALFVAIPGAAADGHDFAPAAVAAGAAALLVERRVEGLGVPQIVVGSARRALATAAAWFEGEPSRRLGIVGITGTDGKTTTAALASAVLHAAGIPSGLLSTVATRIGGVETANRVHATTPEAPALQAALAAMVRAGDRAAVLETTSHGLALHRVAEVDYDVAILTNVTHEHLELHGTIEAYRAAKLRLFETLGERRGPATGPKAALGWVRTGIVNADDPSAGLFGAATHAAGARLITYGLTTAADVQLREATPDGPGHRVTFDAPSGPGAIHVRLPGRFNVANALAVVALGEAIGLDPTAVAAGIASVTGVAGRMVRIEAGQPFEVIVDFAHTPASLEAVLDAAVTEARIHGGGAIAVFGSAGERDRTKRPLMGRVAADRCRLVVLTDEDPRHEDRMAILREIAAGAASPTGDDRIRLVPDRREAIRTALTAARPGDVVVLAGKGHETTIEMATGDLAWDEAAEARAALAEVGFGRSADR